MPKTKFSDPYLRSAKTGTHWDETLSGFGLRVGAKAKTFIVLLGSGNRHKIGRYPLINLADAREQARQLLAKRTLGHRTPAPSATFATILPDFYEAMERKNRPRTVKDYRYHLTRHWVPTFGHRKVGEITRHDITHELRRFKDRPGEGSHALKNLKGFFSWTVGAGYLETNPCFRMPAIAPQKPRERVLGDGELFKVIKAAFNGSEPYTRILSLLICTGQRRGEIAALEWSWIDFTEHHITLPPRIVKNKREHRFPITDRVEVIFQSIPRIEGSPYVFPAARSHVRGNPTTVFNGWSKGFSKFMKGLDGVAPFTPHDFRRTLSSKMAELGVSQTVVEKLLNHVSGGTQSPIAQVYNRYNFMKEMREAINLYDAYLSKLLETA